MTEETKLPDFITLDDFLKVDIRAGRITAAEAISKSEMLKLQVDFGELGVRQVLARIGKSYEPAAIVDLTAAFVVNLPPRVMKERRSEGMILAAHHDSGAAVLFLPGAVLPGTRVA